MLGMTIRRIREYHAEVRRIQAHRDIRALHVARVAGHADENGFEKFLHSLEQKIDPMAGVTIITLGSLSKKG